MAIDYGGSSVGTTDMKLWLQIMVAALLFYKYEIMASGYGGSYFVTTIIKLWIQIATIMTI